MSEPKRHPFLRLEGITKRYGGVTALANVNFECSLGTIHAVVGENGAGKSSLIKVVAGVIQPDEGRIYLDDKPVHFASPAKARGMASPAFSRSFRSCPIFQSPTISRLRTRRNVLD